MCGLISAVKLKTCFYVILSEQFDAFFDFSQFKTIYFLWMKWRPSPWKHYCALSAFYVQSPVNTNGCIMPEKQVPLNFPRFLSRIAAGDFTNNHEGSALGVRWAVLWPCAATKNKRVKTIFLATFVWVLLYKDRHSKRRLPFDELTGWYLGQHCGAWLAVASQRQGCGFTSGPGAILCVLLMFSPMCLGGFFPSSMTSSLSPKNMHVRCCENVGIRNS